MEENSIVFLNGKWIKENEVRIPVRTHAFLYGTSVFEGIRAYWNSEEKQLYAFRIKEHMERLFYSAKIMHMKLEYSVDECCDIVKELVKRNGFKTDCYIRPQIYKSGYSIGQSLLNNEDSFLIFALPFGEYHEVSNPLKVCVSNWRRSDDNAIPPRAKIGGNYANSALAISDAQLAGFDEAIFLSSDGHVTEGSSSNLFLVKDGKLITTTQTDNILIGITRNTIKTIAEKELGMETIEREIDRTELYLADEAFFCGTGAQICPIASIDNRVVGSGSTGEVVNKIKTLYFNIVKGKMKNYSKWCTAIYD